MHCPCREYMYVCVDRLWRNYIPHCLRLIFLEQDPAKPIYNQLVDGTEICAFTFHPPFYCLGVNLFFYCFVVRLFHKYLVCNPTLLSRNQVASSFDPRSPKICGAHLRAEALLDHLTPPLSPNQRVGSLPKLTTISLSRALSKARSNVACHVAGRVARNAGGNVSGDAYGR